MAQSITFYGAAETVTGSRHLLEIEGKRILVDCGLFQGTRELNQRNWSPFPVPPGSIDAVIITHAHMDHIGYLPAFVRDGYAGPIYCTAPTADLMRISLPDSGRIQEEEARFHNRHGTSRHDPALPLYTEKDAYACLKNVERLHYHEFHDLPGKATFRLMSAGHILGSAFAEIYFPNGERILMSGDLGRPNTPIITDPTIVDFAEYLVIESTYGNRLHPKEDVAARLESILTNAFQNGGVVLVPSFAIGRTQELLYYIHLLQHDNRLPRIPIFVDSPMATSTTGVYKRSKEDHDDEMKLEISEGHDPLMPDNLNFVRDANQSKALNSQGGPMLIISGSGMATGGRIIHHLKHRLGNPTTTVLFTGFQVSGTLGRRLIDGAESVMIHGVEVPVRAKIDKLNSLSAHADSGEILQWLSYFKSAPRQTFIVHGEPAAQAALQQSIREQLAWSTTIPRQGERFEL